MRVLIVALLCALSYAQTGCVHCTCNTLYDGYYGDCGSSMGSRSYGPSSITCYDPELNNGNYNFRDTGNCPSEYGYVALDGWDCPSGTMIDGFEECVVASYQLGIVDGFSPRNPLYGDWNHVPPGCIIEAMYDHRINYNLNLEPNDPNRHGNEEQFIRICRNSTEEPEPICEDGDEDTTNPCQPLYCEAGEWLHIIVDCAEQMGMECLAEWMPAAEGECCSSCPCDGSNGACVPKVCTDGSNAPVPPGECCGDMSLCPTTTTTTTTTAGPTHAPTTTTTTMPPTTTTTTMPPTTTTTTSLIVIDDGYVLPDSGLLDSMVRMLNRDYSNARLIAAGQRAAALLQAKDEDKVKLATLYDPAVKGHLQKIRRFFKADESTYSEAVFNKQRVQYNKIAEIVGRDLGEW